MDWFENIKRASRPFLAFNFDLSAQQFDQFTCQCQVDAG